MHIVKKGRAGKREGERKRGRKRERDFDASKCGYTSVICFSFAPLNLYAFLHRLTMF